MIENDVPVIKFNETVEGGMPVKYKVLLDAVCEFVI